MFCENKYQIINVYDIPHWNCTKKATVQHFGIGMEDNVSVIGRILCICNGSYDFEKKHRMCITISNTTDRTVCKFLCTKKIHVRWNYASLKLKVIFKIYKQYICIN